MITASDAKRCAVEKGRKTEDQHRARRRTGGIIHGIRAAVRITGQMKTEISRGKATTWQDVDQVIVRRKKRQGCSNANRNKQGKCDDPKGVGVIAIPERNRGCFGI